MNELNYDWLGFASTSEDALRITRDTAIFYLSISVAYLLSFLYMLGQSSTTKEKRKVHCGAILLWAIMGILIHIYPKTFSLFLNTLLFLFALLVLFQLQFTSTLMAQGTLKATKEDTNNKKALYAITFLAKTKHTLNDILGFTVINELILWLLILYRAGIALRASLAL
jgi:hypothetical protein